jgi:hypothetical protein
MAEEVETTIVIAATDAQAPAPSVERDERRQYQIECPYVRRLGVLRFCYPEEVARHCAVSRQLREAHLEASEYRNEQPFAAAGGVDDYSLQVRFAVKSEENSDSARSAKRRKRLDVTAECAISAGSLLAAERASLSAYLFADRTAQPALIGWLRHRDSVAG